MAMQAKLLADPPVSPVSTPLKEHPNAISFPTNNPYGPMSPPSSSAPLPPSANPALPSAEVSFDPATKDAEKRHVRHRAGSASGMGGAESKSKEMFNDLAQQSKKGFKAMFEKLGGDKDHRERDDGFVVVPPGGDDNVVSGSGGGLQRRGTGARGDPSRGMGTMRGVKFKREADEAGELAQDPSPSKTHLAVSRQGV